eukprot:CAMPEP_0174898676 /NCGR_PEP_ID=MMETSP0167-20121228/23070_1 /TAXON_ID=38298 /ORGANISM="Rhodella maculata, Strain CCMP736" /LENGTH=121 /DNA_ID=CAMNT_0016139385 /DNA_START=205 /DNA_END=568 /DNA_ORIENTATION=-
MKIEHGYCARTTWRYCMKQPGGLPRSLIDTKAAAHANETRPPQVDRFWIQSSLATTACRPTELLRTGFGLKGMYDTVSMINNLDHSSPPTSLDVDPPFLRFSTASSNNSTAAENLSTFASP